VNTPLRRSGMARVHKGSHSFTCTPRLHHSVYVKAFRVFQTDTQTDRCGRKHYHAAFAGDNKITDCVSTYSATYLFKIVSEN